MSFTVVSPLISRKCYPCVQTWCGRKIYIFLIPPPTGAFWSVLSSCLTIPSSVHWFYISVSLWVATNEVQQNKHEQTPISWNHKNKCFNIIFTFIIGQLQSYDSDFTHLSVADPQLSGSNTYYFNLIFSHLNKKHRNVWISEPRACVVWIVW